MNALVDNVNSKIKAVCNETPQCVYVDNEAAIDRGSGRFCEPGVDETTHFLTTGVSANR